MEKEYLTNSPAETKALGKKIARTLRGGEIICLSGDLGAGKTTFTQGLLEELGAQGPYTSPTFVVLKNYKGACRNLAIYHIDAYRISFEDLLGLGFRDFAGKPQTVTIVEWPENVREVLPDDALNLKIEWLDETRRRLTFSRFTSL